MTKSKELAERRNKKYNNTKEEDFVMTEHYSGPIPDPSSLKKYESIKKGLANRIISMAEKEQLDRHKKSAKVIHD